MHYTLIDYQILTNLVYSGISLLVPTYVPSYVSLILLDNTYMQITSRKRKGKRRKERGRKRKRKTKEGRERGRSKEGNMRGKEEGEGGIKVGGEKVKLRKKAIEKN